MGAWGGRVMWAPYAANDELEVISHTLAVDEGWVVRREGAK